MQQKNDDSNLHEIIPISFNMYQVLENNFYLENNSYNDKYLIQLPKVHGMRKNLDPNLKPEKQHTLPKQGSLERLHIGQGSAGSKRKRPDPINHVINQASNLSGKFLEEQK